MTDNPFAKLGSTSTATEEPTGDIASDYLTFSLTLGDEAFEQPEFKPDFIKPANDAWVPVEVISAKVGSRPQDILTVRDAKGRLVVDPNEIKALLKQGHKESLEKVPLVQFELELDLQATCYGEKGRSYLLGVPVRHTKVRFKNGAKKRGETGFAKISGAKLIAATGVLERGATIQGNSPEETEKILQDLAEKMVGKIVMARIRYADKTYKDSEVRKKPNGDLVKAQADKHDSLIRIVEITKDGEEPQLVLEATKTPYTGDKSELIKYTDGVYLIPDDSPDGVPVKDQNERTVTFDNLQSDVQRVPERIIEIERLAGGTVDAEITWDTIGRIVMTPIKAGTVVQAKAKDGEIITASWLGTHWSELEPHELTVVKETGEVRILPVAQASANGLDEFAK